MVTLLPIPTRHCNIAQKRVDEQRQTKREVPNTLLWRILQPLTIQQHPRAGITVFCVQMATSGIANWI